MTKKTEAKVAKQKVKKSTQAKTQKQSAKQKSDISSRQTRVEPKRNNPLKKGGESRLKDSYETYGWYNPKYDQSLLDKIVPLYKDGASDIEVAVELNVSRKGYERWMKRYPEFREEVEKGREFSEAWWRKLGRAGAAGMKNVNSALWFGNMKNRFGWRDAPDESQKNSQEIKEIKEILGKIKSHEKEY